MIKQILEHARPVMQLSIAMFFLVGAGWMVKLYWIEEPIQALGRRLLAKDGALLIKILSDDRTINSIRRLTASSRKGPPRPGPLHHLFDRLVAKDGILIKQLSVALLQQPTIQKLLLRPPGSSAQTKASKGPPPLVTLGKYAIDQLLAKDARLANKLTLDIIDRVVPKPVPKTRKPGEVPDAWAMIERLGRHALQRLLARDAKLALHVTKEIIASQLRATKGKKPDNWHPQQLVKGLGEYAIDRLTASRAQPLRAILQSILGPEPMRALRSLRQVVQRLSHQLSRIHVGQLAREAAYQLGRGGLEAFLREQQQTRQQEARQRRKLQGRRSNARRQMRQKAPCFVPRGDRWLAYEKGAITASLHVLQQPKMCSKQQCLLQRRQARQLLWQLTRDLVKDPADLVIELTPSCEGPQKADQRAGSQGTKDHGQAPTQRRSGTKQPRDTRPSPTPRRGTHKAKSRPQPTPQRPGTQRTIPPKRRKP